MMEKAILIYKVHKNITNEGDGAMNVFIYVNL